MRRCHPCPTGVVLLLGLSASWSSIGSPHNPLLLLCFSSSTSSRHQQQHHHSGRRWRVRRKTQTFLPSPVRDVSHEDECAILEQLGYIPPNLCCVSARNASRRPIAIKSYPLVVQQLVKNGADSNNNDKSSNNKNNITPFPTLYWLSCPHIARAISELEREGYVRLFQQRIEDDVEELGVKWWKCHEQYANERWRLLSTHDRDWLLMPEELKETQRQQSMREMIEMSGVAGTNHHGEGGQGLGDIILCVPSVKCLHSHYAHYRSQLSSLQSSENTRDDDRYGKIVLNMVGQWTHELLLESFPGLML